MEKDSSNFTHVKLLLKIFHIVQWALFLSDNEVYACFSRQFKYSQQKKQLKKGLAATNVFCWLYWPFLYNVVKDLFF